MPTPERSASRPLSTGSSCRVTRCAPSATAVPFGCRSSSARTTGKGSIFRGRVDILPRTPSRIDALFERAPAPAREGMRRVYAGLPARRAAADFGGDYGFWYPSTRVADFHSRYAAVWDYRFDFATRLLKVLGLDATHGVEMFALFDTTDVPLARIMTALGGLEAYEEAGRHMREPWLRFAEGALAGGAVADATRSADGDARHRRGWIASRRTRVASGDGRGTGSFPRSRAESRGLRTRPRPAGVERSCPASFPMLTSTCTVGSRAC